LQRNFLAMLSPATLHPATASLASLVLDHNPICSLPLNMHACTALTLLSCCHARLSYVPALPPRLLTLRLHDNRLLQVNHPSPHRASTSVLLDVFLQMPDDIPRLTLLKEARLYNNQISAVFPAAIAAAGSVVGNVRVLRLINNHVTTPLLNIIAAACPLIEELALSHNRISVLQGAVCALAKLQRLLLHGNRICDIAPEVSALTSLETLILTENRLVRLPPQLGACCKLQVRQELPNTAETVTTRAGAVARGQPLGVSSGFGRAARAAGAQLLPEAE
jgi:Leucine-rich repeat (LRR) protein